MKNTDFSVYVRISISWFSIMHWASLCRSLVLQQTEGVSTPQHRCYHTNTHTHFFLSPAFFISAHSSASALPCFSSWLIVTDWLLLSPEGAQGGHSTVNLPGPRNPGSLTSPVTSNLKSLCAFSSIKVSLFLCVDLESRRFSLSGKKVQQTFPFLQIRWVLCNS